MVVHLDSRAMILLEHFCSLTSYVLVHMYVLITQFSSVAIDLMLLGDKRLIDVTRVDR